MDPHTSPHAAGQFFPDAESDLAARRNGFQESRREAAILLLLLATLPAGLGLRLGVSELTPELDAKSQAQPGVRGGSFVWVEGRKWSLLGGGGGGVAVCCEIDAVKLWPPLFRTLSSCSPPPPDYHLQLPGAYNILRQSGSRMKLKTQNCDSKESFVPTSHRRLFGSFSSNGCVLSCKYRDQTLCRLCCGVTDPVTHPQGPVL